MYDGCVQSLLDRGATKKKIMEGSLFIEILQAATASIVPLNLLDPDSPDFHPKKCENLHDITRFAHEKSVHEMFKFRKGASFQRAFQQTVGFCHVPMQWWIINLDDGFRRMWQEIRFNWTTLSRSPC